MLDNEEIKYNVISIKQIININYGHASLFTHEIREAFIIKLYLIVQEFNITKSSDHMKIIVK